VGDGLTIDEYRERGIIFFLVIIFSFFGFYLVYTAHSPENKIENDTDLSKSYVSNYSIDNSSLNASVEQEYFFEYPSWKSQPIYYYYTNKNNCTSEQIRKFEVGLSTIKQFTDRVVLFQEGKTEKSIQINCFKEEIIDDNYVVAGEGSPILKNTNEIVGGIINLYDVDCSKYECTAHPTVEMHEILHTLGFDHITNRFSIMNLNIGHETRELDEEIINCLKRIYTKDKNYSCEDVVFFSS